MSEIIVEPYRKEMKSHVIELVRDNSTMFSDKDVQRIEKELDEASNDKRYVAMKSDRVVGYISYGFPCDTRHIWELGWIAVDKTMHGQGIGSLLVKYMDNDILNNSDIHTIWLETMDGSGGSTCATIEFYKKHGYREVGRIVRYYGEHGDCVYFYKDLEK